MSLTIAVPPDLPLFEVSKLIPYVGNPKDHPAEQVAQIVRSIEEFGFVNPILIDEIGSIIAGHGRVLAAQKLGMEEVPVVILEHLTENQKKAYRIADNKLAMAGEWNIELLHGEMEKLRDMDFNLDLTGFSPEELRRLGDDIDELRLANIAAPLEEGQPDPQPQGSRDLLTFSVVVTAAKRESIFSVIRLAKETYQVENSGEALHLICEEWSRAHAQPTEARRRRGRPRQSVQ